MDASDFLPPLGLTGKQRKKLLPQLNHVIVQTLRRYPDLNYYQVQTHAHKSPFSIRLLLHEIRDSMISVVCFCLSMGTKMPPANLPAVWPYSTFDILFFYPDYLHPLFLP